MRQRRDWWMQFWKKKASPDLVRGLGWLWGAIAFLGIGLGIATAIDHFANVRHAGINAAQVGLAAAAYCFYHILRIAWKARSAFALFLSLVPIIVVLIGFKLKLPRAWSPLAEWLAQQIMILPIEVVRPVGLSHFLILLFIAFGAAAIVALAAAKYWCRASTAKGPCVQEAECNGNE